MELMSLKVDYIVLDVAAGPGTLSIPLAKNVKEVYAIDFSIPMIEQLKNGIKETKVQNVFTYVMDG